MRYLICTDLCLQNFVEETQIKTKNQLKLLQSGNLCLQNSIKVELLQLI